MVISPSFSRNLDCPAIERRRSHRHELEPMALLSLRCTKGFDYFCTIRNISPEGIRVEVCCGEDFSPLEFGEQLRVVTCDGAFTSALDGRMLGLVWIRGLEAGFLFEEQLGMSFTELRQLLELNRLLPWMQWRPY
jgi:hypothetical protein